jgi:hypothetical protein
MSTTTTIPAEVVALAALCPSSALVPPVLLTADRQVSRPSRGRTDAQPAGEVRALRASADRPAGWGITTAGRKTRDDLDADWRIAFTIRAPATDAERAAVVAAVSAAWIAEAERILGVGAGDGGDDRLLGQMATADARIRAAIGAARAALAGDTEA